MFAHLILLLLSFTPAHAADGVSGYVAARTDFVRSGVSQTSGHATVQGSVTWTSPSGLFVSTFVSNIDFEPGDPVAAEIDLQAGYGETWAGFEYSAGATRYTFPRGRRKAEAMRTMATAADFEIERPSAVVLPEQLTGGHYNFIEVFGSIARDTPLGIVSLGVVHSPNNSGDTGPATQFTLGLKRALSEKLTLDVNVTRNLIAARSGPDFTDWNMGLTYDFGFVAAEVRYAQATAGACGAPCDAHIVFSLIKAF